jgi:hypothetical protein
LHGASDLRWKVCLTEDNVPWGWTCVSYYCMDSMECKMSSMEIYILGWLAVQNVQRTGMA